MDLHVILDTAWKLMNTPIGVTAVAAVAVWLLGRLSKARPTWKRWEGTIITAVKLAEKTIPEGIANKGLAKLDIALAYVLRIYEKTNGISASKKTTAELKEAIQLIHNELETKGTL